MKWDYKSIESYMEVKEYIDTAIIPMLHIDLTENALEAVTKSTYILGITNYIEEQLRGRVMLFPAYPYTNGAHSEFIPILNQYSKYVEEQGFKHVLWVTQDEGWSEYSTELAGSLFLLHEELKDVHKGKEMNVEEIRQFGERLLPIFIDFWKKG